MKPAMTAAPWTAGAFTETSISLAPSARRQSSAVMGENLSDEKYLASLYWDQAFYAPPRNWTASVGLNF